MTNPSPPRRVPRARWYRIGLLLFLCQLMGHIDRNNIGVAAPGLAENLGLSSNALGVLLSAFFWGYVATQVPGGWLASRYSAKRVLACALLIWGVGAAASGLVTSYPALMATRVVIGLAEGSLFPTITVLIASRFPRSEHARATGLAILALPLSSVIMSPIAGWLIQVWDYHVMFVAMAVPAVLLAVVVTVWISDTPQRDPRLSPQERAYLAEAVEPRPHEQTSLLDVARTPRILLLGLIYFLWQSGIYALALWVPSLVAQASEYEIGIVGVLSAVPFAVGALALFLTARRSDGSRRSRAAFVTIPLVLAGIALVVQHFVPNTLVVNLVFLSLCAAGIYAPFGPWWAWVMRLSPADQVGSTNGLVNAIGNFGGIAGPILVGAASAGGDVRNGFYVLGFALVLAAALAGLLNLRLVRRDRDLAGPDTDSAAADTAQMP